LIRGLAGGLLKVSGVIHYNLQETLLTSGSQVDMKQIEDNAVTFTFCVCFSARSLLQTRSAMCVRLYVVADQSLQLFQDDCKNAMNLLSSALEGLVKNDEAKINIPEVIRRVPACYAGGVCPNKRAGLAFISLDRSSEVEYAIRLVRCCIGAVFFLTSGVCASAGIFQAISRQRD
jgi:predicted metallopeptidase